MQTVSPLRSTDRPVRDARDVRLQASVALPGFDVPQAMMFAHPTRMMDSWVPSIEHIQVPAFHVPGCTATVRVASGETGTRSDSTVPKGRWPAFKHRFKCRMDARTPAIDLGDEYVYDARWKDQGNIAHIIQHVLARLVFARDEIARRRGDCPPISVILPREPPPLAHRVYDFTKTKTVCTNGVVRGNVVTVECEVFYGLLPRLRDYPIAGAESDTPRRVFISRRGSRTLVNEDEVQRFLAREGFERVYFEETPLSRQWSILRNATDIVAIHGAALGGLGFNQARAREDSPSLRLTELFGAGFVVDHFRRYAAVLNGSWSAVRGRTTPVIVRDIDGHGKNFRHAFAPFEIHLGCLERALESHGSRGA